MENVKREVPHTTAKVTTKKGKTIKMGNQEVATEDSPQEGKEERVRMSDTDLNVL